MYHGNKRASDCHLRLANASTGALDGSRNYLDLRLSLAVNESAGELLRPHDLPHWPLVTFLLIAVFCNPLSDVVYGVSVCARMSVCEYT